MLIKKNPKNQDSKEIKGKFTNSLHVYFYTQLSSKNGH